MGDHLDDMGDGFFIVEAGDAYQDVGGSNLLDSFGRIPAKGCVVGHW
jgi:hypothetical protein